MRVYGAWVRICYLFVKKTYGTIRGLSRSPTGSRKAAWNAHICEHLLKKIEKHTVHTIVSWPNPIVLKFDNAAAMPVKFQSDAITVLSHH